jgi:shikimate dehydrogenase
MEDLKNFMGSHSFRNALVLGAGGSARAVVYALVREGCRVGLAARRIEQAQELAEKMRIGINGDDVIPLSFTMEGISPWLKDCDLIINTTPVGMTPKLDTTPWPHGLAYPEQAALYDLVYNPAETLLVKTARACGLPATTGLGMLVEQAALAFQIWTGAESPSKIMRQAVPAIR